MFLPSDIHRTMGEFHALMTETVELLRDVRNILQRELDDLPEGS